MAVNPLKGTDRGEGVYHAEMIAPHAAASSHRQPEPVRVSTTTLTIAPARPRDLPRVARLQRRSFPPRLAYPLGTLALLWAMPWVRLLVARRGEAIVGCVIGDRTAEGGRVINLAVDPAARRQGVGTALLNAIERALPDGDMTLMVQTENSGAHALYFAMGYADEADLPNYYGPDRPGIWMRKRRQSRVTRDLN
ncbi:MAG: GNAT family N-acetyltransferase [Thermomicrobiales bacterium]